MALTVFFADVFYVNCHKDMSRHSLKMICLRLPKKVGRYFFEKKIGEDLSLVYVVCTK